MTKVNRTYLFSIGWGLVSGLTALIIRDMGQRAKLPTVLSIILDVVALGILFWAGRAAKQQNAKPVGVGVVAGLLYSLFYGWSLFFGHVTRAEIIAQLHRHPTTAAVSINSLVKVANSPLIHVGAWIVLTIVWVIAGVALGVIGGLTTKNPYNPKDV